MIDRFYKNDSRGLLIIDGLTCVCYFTVFTLSGAQTFAHKTIAHKTVAHKTIAHKTIAHKLNGK